MEEYPLIAPPDATQAAKWSEFSQTTLGFVPSIYAREQNCVAGVSHESDMARSPTLNAAHQTNYADFVNVSLPRDLPQVAAARKDWIDFVTAPTSLVERHLWQDFLARRYRRVGALNSSVRDNVDGIRGRRASGRTATGRRAAQQLVSI